MSRPALARRLLAALVLALALWCFGDGWAQRWGRPDLQACADDRPASWALGCPAAVRFESFLTTATADLPPGSRLAIAGPVERDVQEAFYYMWADYLLPTSTVVLASDRPPPAQVDYVLAYGREFEMEILEPLRRLPDGVVYRVRHRETPR